jgi:hypothetical protein
MFENIGTEEGLDKELRSINPNNEDGLAKINEAKALLPIHYKNLMTSIGGEITDTFDVSRLPPNIRSMVELFEADTPTLGILANTMVASLTYTNLLHKFRPVIRDVLVSRKTDIPCNTLAINIAPSGSGKDSAFDLGTEALSKADAIVLDKMAVEAEKRAKAIATAKNKRQQEKDGVAPADMKIDSAGWENIYKAPSKGEIKMATYEALLAEAESITKSSDYGNIFIKISELGNSLNLDPNIDRLIMLYSEMYDIGKVPEDLKKTKELKTGAIDGLAPSMLAHTSPAPLVKDAKLVAKLKSILGSYFARRGFFITTAFSESVRNIGLNADLDSQVDNLIKGSSRSVVKIAEIEESSCKVVQRLVDNPHMNVVMLTDDARKLYGKYFTVNKVYRYLSYVKDEGFSSEGLLSELINRHWKAIKLAGIWALAENKSKITVDILASAIYFTEFIGHGLRRLLDLVDQETFERFIKAVESRDIGDSIRYDSLIKQGYITKADKRQIDTFLITVNSAFQGKVVVTADHDKSKVIINRIETKAVDSKYGVSYIKFNEADDKEYRRNKAYKGFKYVNIELKNLVQLLQEDYAYSPFKFKDGYRSNDNVISETNYLVLDVDKSEVPMQVLHETYLSGTLHILSTTSDKNNKYKYRVIIPIKQSLGKNKDIYKYVVLRLAEELMLDIDTSSTTISQFMNSYSGSEVLHNLDSNIEPMDIGDILADSGKHISKTDSYSTPMTKAQQKKAQEAMLHDFETEFEFALNAPMGRGSILLFVAGKKMERAGVSPTGIRTWLHKINSEWASPMPKGRIEAICKQFDH